MKFLVAVIAFASVLAAANAASVTDQSKRHREQMTALKKKADSVAASAKQKHNAANGKNLRTMSESVTTQAYDSVMSDGFFVSRSRPNGDCSGPVNYLIGWQNGLCVAGDGWSYYFTCARDGDNIYQVQNIFNNEDCSGDPIQTEATDSSGPKCYFNKDDLAEDGPTMTGLQCAPDVEPAARSDRSLLQAFYDNAECSDPPVYFVNQRADTCRFNKFGYGSYYAYLSYYCSNDDGTLSSDYFYNGECAGEPYKTNTVTIEEEFGQKLGECVWDGEYYAQIICYE